VAVSVCAMVAPELAEAPVTFVCVTVQAKVDPPMLLVSAILLAVFEQMLWEEGVAVAEGIGLTVMVAVTAEPGQPAAAGVIVYTAVPALVLVAVSVWAITVPELADAPVTFAWFTVHEKVAPATLLLSVTVEVAPEQSVCEVGEAVTVGIGFTVTVATIAAPEQVPTDGVMVYVTVPGEAPVAERVCVIVDPLPAEAPLAPDWETTHAYVVPPMLLVSAIEVALPEHRLEEAGVAVADGIGLTLTVATIGVPAQLPAVGVMV
jgi:hypothetical protein